MCLGARSRISCTGSHLVLLSCLSSVFGGVCLGFSSYKQLRQWESGGLALVFQRTVTLDMLNYTLGASLLPFLELLVVREGKPLQEVN